MYRVIIVITYYKIIKIQSKLDVRVSFGSSNKSKRKQNSFKYMKEGGKRDVTHYVGDLEENSGD